MATSTEAYDYSFVVVCGAQALTPSAFISMGTSDGIPAIARTEYRGLLPDKKWPHDYHCERTTGEWLPPQTLTSPAFRYGGFLFASERHEARTFQGGPSPVPCRRVHGHGDVAVIRLRNRTYIVPAADTASESAPPLTPHVRTIACDQIQRVTTPEQLEALELECPLVRALRLGHEVPREAEEDDDRTTPPRPTYAEMAEFTTTCGLSPDCRPVVEIDIAPTALREESSASPNEVSLLFLGDEGEEIKGLYALADTPSLLATSSPPAACPTCANPTLHKGHHRSNPLCRLYGVARPQPNKKRRTASGVHVRTTTTSAVEW